MCIYQLQGDDVSEDQFLKWLLLKQIKPVKCISCVYNKKHGNLRLTAGPGFTGPEGNCYICRVNQRRERRSQETRLDYVCVLLKDHLVFAWRVLLSTYCQTSVLEFYTDCCYYYHHHFSAAATDAAVAAAAAFKTTFCYLCHSLITQCSTII